MIIRELAGEHNYLWLWLGQLLTTIHKSQGLTLDKVQINIGSKETSLGIAYVAFSRIRTFEGLTILDPYTYERFTKICESTMFNDRNSVSETQKNKDYLFTIWT